ncbi:MAG: MaoC family dehydratase [Steroidobacteraceae bacterium]
MPLYFDDLEPGQRFTGRRTWTVDAAQIKAFAAQFDPQPFHLDDDAARSTLFGGLAASGWHTAALTMRLNLDGGPSLAGGTVGLGADLNWLKPVRPGDTLSIETEVLEIAPSKSRPDRGRVMLRTETRNQLGEAVQVCISKLLVPRRPQSAGG